MTTVDSDLTVAAAALERELVATVAQAAPLLQAELLRGLRGIVAEYPSSLGPTAFADAERRALQAVRRWLPRVSGGFQQPLEVYPRRRAGELTEHATERLIADLRAGFARARLRASLTPEEKREALA